MIIETTTVKQLGNEILGSKEKTLYYLIIKNKINEKLVVNVGLKTHSRVQDLIKNDK